MEPTPLTLEKANDIIEDFEDLIETEFTFQSAVYEINHVLVTPFSNEDKRTFLLAYANTSDAAKALEFYTGADYDVMVIAHKMTGEKEVIARTIREYVTQHGINYNFL